MKRPSLTQKTQLKSIKRVFMQAIVATVSKRFVILLVYFFLTFVMLSCSVTVQFSANTRHCTLGRVREVDRFAAKLHELMCCVRGLPHQSVHARCRICSSCQRLSYQRYDFQINCKNISII